MSVTIEVVCYRSKVLANSHSPLMLRVCKDRKRKYLSIGISVNPAHWDFERNKPKRSCPDRVLLEQVITEKIKTYRGQVLEYRTEDKDFTAASLVEKVESPVKPRTVGPILKARIAALMQEKQTGYAMSHLELYNSLIKFNGHLDIYFSEMDVTWLRRYESSLRSNGAAENTIGKRLRTLRAVFNIAIEQHVVKPEYYPFKAYKISKLHQATAKRSISKREIARVMSYPCIDRYTRLAVDLFTFSYFMGGINFVDMAHLTAGNLMDGRLIYTRKKTGKLIQLPLQPKALEIIHAHAAGNYIFPILSERHTTQQSQRNRIHKVITKVNKRLKEIGKELEIPIGLTT